MCVGGPKIDTSYQDFSIKEAKRARRLENQRQERIDAGMTDIKGVFEGDGVNAGVQPVLDQRRAAQEGYYLPQLDTEYAKAKDQTTFALARAGLLNSTAAGEKQADLGDAFALHRGKILGDIDSDIASTATRMQQSRAAIEAALRASGDASAATNQALASAVNFREDSPTLNPIGNIFYGLGTSIGSARDGYDVGKLRRALSPAPLNRNYSRSVN